MAKKIVTKKGDNPQEINILQSEVRLFQLDRTKVDITRWRAALASAESVFYPYRYELLRIYRELELDAHMNAIMGKRIRNVTNKDLLWKNAAGEVDEKVNERLDKRWFHEAVKAIMQSIFWGHSLVEFETDGPEIVKTKVIPRQHVKPEYGLVVSMPTDTTGIPFREAPYSNFSFEVDLGLGLFNIAAANVIFKRGGTIDYANFVEIFGSPIRELSYDDTYEGAKDEATQIAHDSGNSTFIVHPKDKTDLTIHKGSDGNSGNLHKEFISMLKEELSILVNGQTMTTFSGSSYNQGFIHLQEQDEITEDDKKLVTSILNEQLIKKLVNLGYPELAGGKFFFDDTENLDIKAKLEVWVKVSEKVHIDVDDWYEHFNIPRPKSGARPPEEASKKPMDEPVESKKKPVSSSGGENPSQKEPVVQKSKEKKKTSSKASVTTPKA